MKTQLQTELAKIAPSISIKTIWEHDPDCEREFKDLSKNPGDCFYGEKRSNWQPWQSEIRVSSIVGGEELTASEYMGATWEKRSANPERSNPDISGYEPQMTEEALGSLYKQISITAPGAQDVAHQITAAIAHIKAKN